jgi:hypothetical protein
METFVDLCLVVYPRGSMQRPGIGVQVELTQ